MPYKIEFVESYITNIFGVAEWYNNRTLDTYPIIPKNNSNPFESYEINFTEPTITYYPLRMAYRFPDGDFSSNILDKVTPHDTQTNQTNNTPNNEKYYCKDNLTNQEYFIYKNGSICKVDNSSFTPYDIGY